MQYTVTEFEAIYKRCYPRAVGLAHSLLYDAEEAMDIAQQVFAALWDTRIQVDNPDAFVYRSVKNMCINRINTNNNRERIKKLYAIDTETIDDDIDKRLDDVRDAIKSLSTREQEVVNEIFSQGSTYREAAANLNVSVSTINKNVVSALRSLRAHFKIQKK